MVEACAADARAALFDTVVTWSDVPGVGGDASPDIFLLAAGRLEARPDRCLVYEDADAGVTHGGDGPGMTAYNVLAGSCCTPNRPCRPSELFFESAAGSYFAMTSTRHGDEQPSRRAGLSWVMSGGAV